MNADPGSPKTPKQTAREERRAAALRENLRRRKSQARARAAQTAGSAATTGTDGEARGGPNDRRESEP
jgi:hypothetical protein